MNGFGRPEHNEHADRYRKYVDLVPDGDIFQTLVHQLGETLSLFQEVPPSRETHRYKPNKWSIRGVAGHLIDLERVLAHQALGIARSESIVLPGIDRNEWADSSNADQRSLEDLAAEWAVLRRSTVHMLSTLPTKSGGRSGVASGAEFTVRCFPWIIAGHELWHRDLLRRDYSVGSAGSSCGRS